MLGLSRSQRVFAYPAPVDLRKGFDGLSHLVRWHLDKDPHSGDCYLFTNRSRRNAKVLVWDGTGLGIYAKRLEVGRFAALWTGQPGEPIALTAPELALFLQGCSLVGKVALSPPEFSP